MRVFGDVRMSGCAADVCVVGGLEIRGWWWVEA